MPVQVGIDRVDVAERALVELLQDRELDARVALDRAQRFGKRLDDRRRRQRIARSFKLGTAEQVADGAIELVQLVVTEVLHHADDIAGEYGLVHRRRIDQRKLAGVERGEIGLGLLTLHPPVDQQTQIALELRHEIGALGHEHAARIEAQRLLVADIRFFRTQDQKIADAVEHRGEGKQQAMDREIPAIAEDLRRLPRQRVADCRFAGSGGVHLHSTSFPRCGGRTLAIRTG